MATELRVESPEEQRPAAMEDCGCGERMFRSSDDVRKGYVRGISAFRTKAVQFSVIDDIAIFEGDIALAHLTQRRIPDFLCRDHHGRSQEREGRGHDHERLGHSQTALPLPGPRATHCRRRTNREPNIPVFIVVSFMPVISPQPQPR